MDAARGGLARVQRERARAPGRTRRVAILPCGVDLTRFRPIPRAEARERLGLDPDGPYLLFPHDTSRPLKRFDRAQEAAGDVPLLTLGGVPAEEVPYWINAANAVDRAVAGRGHGARGDRGVGVRRARVRHTRRCARGVAGRDRGLGVPASGTATPGARRCAPHLAARDPRVDGRAAAERFSADRMAARVVAAWRALLDEAA